MKIGGDDALLVQKIAKAEASLAELQRQKATPKIDLDIAAAEVSRQRLVDQLDALQAKKTDPKIDLDIAAAEFRRAELVMKLDELQAKPYTVTAELAQDKLLLQIAQVQSRLDALAAKKTKLDIDTDEAAILVKIATVQERIDRLNGQKTTINIDADIGATEAKIAALEAQLAGLGETTAAAGDAATVAGAEFNWMAAGIGVAFPPASSAVLALSGALELAAIPLVAIKLGMGGIQAAAAPLAGSFLNLQSVVAATFENGLKPAITTVSALIPTLQAGLVGTATSLTGVATSVGKVVSSQPGLIALQATFSNIQSTIVAMTPGIAGFAQNVVNLGELGTGALSGLANMVNGLATQWRTLITNLTSSGVAQVAIQSLVDVLSAVMSIIPPLVQAGVQLMAVIGPPLAGALNLVSGAVQLLAGPLGGLTNIVLASLAAWKLFSAMGALVEAGLAKIGLGAAAAATAQEAQAASTYTTAAAAATAATTLEAQAAAATSAAAAAAAHAATTEAAAVALASQAAAAATAATTDAELAAAESLAADAALAQAGASEAATAALAAQAGAGRAAAAASGATAASTAATGAAAAGAAAATSRFGAALGLLGRVLLPVGIAAVASYVAIKSFTSSTDEATSAMARGGQAAEEMAARVKSQSIEIQAGDGWFVRMNASANNWFSSNILGMATIDSVTEAVSKHRAGLTDLQRAQEDATTAAGDYQLQLDRYGAGSIQATEAQKKLAEATLKVTQAQAAAVVAQTNLSASMQAAAGHFGSVAQAADGAAQAAITYANALATLADPLAGAGDKTKAFAADMANAADAPRNLLAAMNAANSSITSFAESTDRITPALVSASGSINTATKAGQDLATGILGTAKAYDNLRGATIASSQAAGDTMSTALAKGGVALEDFRQKLMTQAQQHGATRAQAQGLVDTYLAFPPSIKTEISQPGMTEAYVNALGLGKAITGLPTNTTVTVKSLTDDARRKLEDLGFVVQKLPNGQIIIGADIGQVGSAIALAKQQAEATAAVMKLKANPQEFYDSIHDGVGAALATTGANIPIGGVPDGFHSVLRDSVGAALATEAQMPLSANPAGFDAVVVRSVGMAGSMLAVIPMDGTPDAFNGKVEIALRFANGSTGVIALDGNPELVNGKTTAAVRFADGSTGRITLDGNPDPATGKIRAVVDFGNGQHTIVTIDPRDLATPVLNGIPRQINTVVVITSQDLRESHGGAGGGLVGYSGGGIAGSVRRFATGGVLGGYAPGKDTIPAILSPGEAVLVPELVRRLGPGNILAANMEASGRQPTFWNGGRPSGGDGVALGPLAVGSAVSAGPAPGVDVARVVAQLRELRNDTTRVTSQLSTQVGQLAEVVRRSGTGASIVVNDASGNPVETARSAIMQLRVRH